jgi:hypothetical protein
VSPALARLVMETIARIPRTEAIEDVVEQFILDYPDYPWLDWAHELILARGAVH